VLTYEAYRERRSGAREAPSSSGEVQAQPNENGRAEAPPGAGATARDASTDEEVALHLPTLWTWLEEATDNVKSYKNTQAFVLMEASDALQAIGVSTLEDLRALEQCSEPAVVRSLEAAIENNVDESIPPRCYQ